MSMTSLGESEVASDAATTSKSWNPVVGILFRFVLIYFVLYKLPWPVDRIPVIGETFRTWYFAAWNAVVAFVGEQLLGIAMLAPAAASPGDSTWAHVQLLILAFISALGGLVWTVLDRRRHTYDAIHEWFRLYLRVHLVLIMFGYGIIKVIKSQWSFPWYEDLVRPLGANPQMSLIPIFMGSSTLYMCFTGIVEILGAVLLLSRRTTTAGTLIIFATLINVLMLNMSYDFPVKLYILHLLATAFLLMIPDLKRLANVLLLNRPAAARRQIQLAATPWKRALLAAGVGVFVLTGAWNRLDQLLPERHGNLGDQIRLSELDGIWDVEEFVHNGEILPPLLSDSIRWQKLLITHSGYAPPSSGVPPTQVRASVMLMNDSLRSYNLEIDTMARTLILHGRGRAAALIADLQYAWRGHRDLTVEGTVRTDTVRMHLKRRDAADYPLLRRRFRWIIDFG